MMSYVLLNFFAVTLNGSKFMHFMFLQSDDRVSTFIMCICYDLRFLKETHQGIVGSIGSV
jgi:hypothetical protein